MSEARENEVREAVYKGLDRILLIPLPVPVFLLDCL